MSEPTAPQPHNLTLNLVAVREIVNLGIRRAVAFIGVGLRRDNTPLPTSLVLNDKFELRWFPEPLPENVAGEIVQEYNAWLTGSALKELDQFFAQYLDEVWHIFRLAQFHGKPLPADYGPDKSFLANTNVSSKLAEVAGSLALELPEFSSFSSLSLARNALTHMSCGVCLVKQGDLQQGLKWIERAHDLAPDNERIARNLAELKSVL